jgi:hypothetical protein
VGFHCISSVGWIAEHQTSSVLVLCLNIDNQLNGKKTNLKMSVEFNNLMVSDSANKLEVAELSELIESKFKLKLAKTF